MWPSEFKNVSWKLKNYKFLHIGKLIAIQWCVMNLLWILRIVYIWWVTSSSSYNTFLSSVTWNRWLCSIYRSVLFSTERKECQRPGNLSAKTIDQCLKGIPGINSFLRKCNSWECNMHDILRQDAVNRWPVWSILFWGKCWTYL